MSVPPDGSGNRSQPACASPARSGTVGPVGHYSCCLFGLLLTVLVVASVYPLLVAITEPFGVLSSTTLLFGVVACWLASWLAFELVWAWGSIRVRRADRAR